jgi:hypothetical protein
MTQAFDSGLQEGWDRITAPVSGVLNGVESTAKTALVLYFAVAALAIFLAYKYFKAGGKIPTF